MPFLVDYMVASFDSDEETVLHVGTLYLVVDNSYVVPIEEVVDDGSSLAVEEAFEIALSFDSVHALKAVEET